MSADGTGNKWWGQENLKPEYHKAFADYITDVVKQYADVCGVKFDYLAAFNEPVEGWWYINKKKKSQEGCNFSVKSAEKVCSGLQRPNKMQLLSLSSADELLPWFR